MGHSVAVYFRPNGDPFDIMSMVDLFWELENGLQLVVRERITHMVNTRLSAYRKRKAWVSQRLPTVQPPGLSALMP